MNYTCPICKAQSENKEGREVWARECGFYELVRLGPNGERSGYSVCSKQCAAILLSDLMTCVPETKPSGKPSRTWKCEQCSTVLPQHIYQSESSKMETVPTVTQLVYPNEWDKYHCFCSDACLLKNLRES